MGKSLRKGKVCNEKIKVLWRDDDSNINYGGIYIISQFSNSIERYPLEIHADYPGFQSLGKMEEYVDAVVVAEVVKVHPSYINEEIKDRNFFATDADVIVEQVKKGSNFTGEKLMVKQDGGEVDGKKQVWDHVKYFKPEERYILYLMQLENGKYAPVNPVQGALKITNGKVKFGDSEYNVSEIMARGGGS